jgi:hypothetical protein
MATKTIDQLPSSSPLVGNEVLPIVQGNETLKTTVQDIANLAGISGTNFIYVAADGTDTANATALSTTYNTAKTMSPSATNRITIVAAPGYYNFGTSVFTMDTQYIDLVSLDGNRSIIFNSSNSNGTISITANDVFVKGVDVQTKNFTIASNLNLLKVENCNGGGLSFGGDITFGSNPITVSGTFTNCQGGSISFGGAGTASGTFINCIGDDNSFGLIGTASGTFINCIGFNNSFGSGGTASGTFTNCTGGLQSFGSGGTASGTFTNCTGGDGSFGGTASGTFTNCAGGAGSFGGGGGTASGTFTSCVGGAQSFAGGGGTASGTFTSCVGDIASFGTSFTSGGTASGIFTNCIGGTFSFGGRGTLSGKLYYCRLTSGTFATVSGAGVTRLCLDGSNAEDNQG